MIPLSVFIPTVLSPSFSKRGFVEGILVLIFTAFSCGSPPEESFDYEKSRLEALVEYGTELELESELNHLKASALKSGASLEDQFLLAYLQKLELLKSDNSKERKAEAEILAKTFERISRRNPNHELADDALMELGEIRKTLLGQEALAKAAFFEVVDRYPGSDQKEKAETVLEEGDGGSQAARELLEEKKDSGVLAWLDGVFKDEKKLPKPSLGLKTVVIDPGHGGRELGAVGVDGLQEKTVVLAISKRLKTILEKDSNVRVILTRESDGQLPLSARTKFANEKEADLFLSIHANASPNKRARGVETYYLDNTDDASSLKLAKRENNSAGPRGSDLNFILSDLIQSAKQDDSITLAHMIQDNLVRGLRTKYEGIRDLGVKKAPFYVLVGAHMPCVLVEVSFIDHKVDGKRLAMKEYQDLIAEALAEGVFRYFRFN